MAGVVLAGLVGCRGDDDDGRGGGDEGSAPAGEESSTSTTVDPADVEAEAVIAARQAARAAHVAALGPPAVNGSHPELLATHTGAALEVVQADAELMALTFAAWVGRGSCSVKRRCGPWRRCSGKPGRGSLRRGGGSRSPR